MPPRPGSLEWLELRIEEEQGKQDELRAKYEELKEWVATAAEQRREVESVLRLRQQPSAPEPDDEEDRRVLADSPGPLDAGPRGVIPASATASPGYTTASANQGSAAASPPDVWDDIIGPVGFLQQFENKLFEMDESRVSSSASQPQPENSAVVASGVGVRGIDDGDEGEAGEVTVFQAVLRHVEERRMRQHALQEDLRLELELTREEQAEHDDKLENETTGLIPEIKEKMRLLEKKQSSRDELEMEKAKLEDEVRRAMEEYEAHRLRVIDHAATATRSKGGATTEPMFASSAAGEPPAALLSPSEVLMQAERDCAMARERADALREAMSHLAQAAEVATRLQSEPK